MTVQELVPPAGKIAGAQFTESRVGRVRPRVKLAELPFKVAVTTADWLPDRLPAVTGNVAELALPITEIELGTPRKLLLLLRSTVAPGAGIGLLSVTVQVVLELDARLVTAHCTAEIVGRLTRLRVTV